MILWKSVKKRPKLLWPSSFSKEWKIVRKLFNFSTIANGIDLRKLLMILFAKMNCMKTSMISV